MSVKKATWTGVICWTLFAGAVLIALGLAMATRYDEAVLVAIIGGCFPALNAGAWRAEELAPTKKNVVRIAEHRRRDEIPIYLRGGDSDVA